MSNIRARISKLERDGGETAERWSLERLLMIGTGHAEPTPTEQAQLDALQREIDAKDSPDAIEQELERLLADLKPKYGLKELPPTPSENYHERATAP